MGLRETISGWGRYPATETRLLQARGERELAEHATREASIIARGNGRAYGDAALNAHATLSSLCSDRILGFDAATGTLTCEAGLLLADILRIYVPRGWFVPVSPGSKFVTVGGMIAADVHGKNHHHVGTFGRHVKSLRLLKANGEVVNCSARENTELFAATCGGMGLTGVIISASFTLIRIPSATITQTTTRTANLAQTMAAFEAARDATYSVAWVDCFARGAALGRSILYTGEHAEAGELAFAAKTSLPIPIDFPGFALNRFTLTAFNALYYRLAKPGVAQVPLDTFFYPLDRLLNWNRIYGRRGFVQFQCVIPKAQSAAGIAALLDRISEARLGSFLAVLKLLGAGSRYMSFPMEGYTLALDFPVNAKTLALVAALGEITTEYGGRVYLAKDACATPEQLAAGYPELDAFKQLIRVHDPAQKFSSLQSQRLGIT